MNRQRLTISIHSLVKRETRYIDGMRWEDVNISIHSLVKRETFYDVSYRLAEFEISIHSLVKRETTFKTAWKRKAVYFNPLPRKEGDGTLVTYSM